MNNIQIGDIYFSEETPGGQFVEYYVEGKYNGKLYVYALDEYDGYYVFEEHGTLRAYPPYSNKVFFKDISEII